MVVTAGAACLVREAPSAAGPLETARASEAAEMVGKVVDTAGWEVGLGKAAAVMATVVAADGGKVQAAAGRAESMVVAHNTP